MMRSRQMMRENRTMSQFRWISKALVGPWCATRKAALSDALGYGQAVVDEGKGAVITLRHFASMETRKSAEAK